MDTSGKDGIDITYDLYEAVNAENAEKVSQMIALGADVNSHVMGHTPLHMAVQTGNAELVRLLLEASADPTAVDGDGTSVIHAATEIGAADCVAALLAHNQALVNTVGEAGFTILHVAVEMGDVDMLGLILTAPVEVNTRIQGGSTAVNMAAEHGLAGIVKMLLEVGADPTIPDDDGDTPMSNATREGHQDVVAILEARETLDPRRVDHLSNSSAGKTSAAEMGEEKSYREENVLHRFPVYLSNEIKELYLFQFPLRPSDRHYPIDDPETIMRYNEEFYTTKRVAKSKDGRKEAISVDVVSDRSVDIEYGLETTTPEFDTEAPHQITKNKLTGTYVKSKTTFAVGHLMPTDTAEGHQLTLTPITGIMQVRPTFTHLDQLAEGETAFNPAHRPKTQMTVDAEIQHRTVPLHFSPSVDNVARFRGIAVRASKLDEVGQDPEKNIDVLDTEALIAHLTTTTRAKPGATTQNAADTTEEDIRTRIRRNLRKYIEVDSRVANSQRAVITNVETLLAACSVQSPDQLKAFYHILGDLFLGIRGHLVPRAAPAGCSSPGTSQWHYNLLLLILRNESVIKAKELRAAQPSIALNYDDLIRQLPTKVDPSEGTCLDAPTTHSHMTHQVAVELEMTQGHDWELLLKGVKQALGDTLEAGGYLEKVLTPTSPHSPTADERGFFETEPAFPSFQWRVKEDASLYWRRTGDENTMKIAAALAKSTTIAVDGDVHVFSASVAQFKKSLVEVFRYTGPTVRTQKLKDLGFVDQCISNMNYILRVHE
ncbi:hypothetical protein J8273_4330 [Carpediemonas membranifera]|uniref:Ankyrin repeat protein n=1 Tax=Carpediemonas membranifera TaxID=201153 RepID=A0A8J6AU43_9EUKA|nr:hypothetical protein J8273_4330 [Carpediemonas membranifera]|eukprot:KAG9394228.1 hypothetical protein J8273_4330 [Carpediemonas membranifera]